MTDEMNGHKPEPAGQSKPPELTPQMQAKMLVEGFCGPVAVAAVNGVQKSLPQFPVDALMLTMCATLGRVMGEVFSLGELVPVMQIRDRCVKEFERELKKVAIKAPTDLQKSKFVLPPDTADLLKKLSS